MPAQFVDDEEFLEDYEERISRISKHPQSPGSWVTGRNEANKPFSSLHASCIFEILDEAEQEELSSGSVQGVVCVIDGEVFKTVDTSYLRESVSEERLLQLEKTIKSMRQQLKVAHQRITRKING